jgi:hypothetical protein
MEIEIGKPRSSPEAGFSFLCYTTVMSDAVDYLFAPSLNIAGRAARKQGWRPHGRTGWLKPDGIEVQFICFEEQLAVTSKHVTVYFVGALPPRLGRSNRKWEKIRA